MSGGGGGAESLGPLCFHGFGSLGVKDIFKSIDAEGVWFSFVQHRMAVWADWYEVGAGVDYIRSAHLRNRQDVVNMDELPAQLSVFLLKIKVADLASMSMFFNAGGPVDAAPFVFFSSDFNCTAFHFALFLRHFNRF